MIPKELFGPTDLTKAQTLYIHEFTKVIMVCKHWTFVLVAFQVVAPGFKIFKNSYKITIVSFVFCFGQNHFPQKVYYWVSLA